METLQTESTPEEHTLIITDVRFRPNSTQLATSSFDTTVRLWDAAEVNSLSLSLSQCWFYIFVKIIPIKANNL